MKIHLTTERAPAAIGPYSQGVRCVDTVYLSGQLGLDPKTGTLKNGVEAQTVQAFANIVAVLDVAGLTLADVVKTTVFLKDLDDFEKMNAVYARTFEAPYPARSTVQVARLPKDALVEIEVTAIK
ncbi:MAG TPA: reactive intermediate/imine deaminase [Planctomycetaceae bacterium]|nr:reactive intermediate/imine deaminase [Planctomycetaceae bacterium]